MTIDPSSSSAKVFPLVDVHLASETLQVQITFNKNNNVEWENAPLKKAFTIAIAGEQKKGKSFLLKAISGVPFVVGNTRKRTTEGIDAALVERNQRVEVLLDSEGWNSTQTKKDFKEKLQKLRPGMNAQELDMFANDQAAKLEAKFGALLYRTSDVIIVYSPDCSDSAITFLKNMSKSPTVFKPHIMIVTRELNSEEELKEFQDEMLESLEDVKTIYRKIDFFYIPNAKQDEEAFQKVVRQIQESIASSRALRVSTVSDTLTEINRAMKDINNDQKHSVPKWVEILSYVRNQSNSTTLLPEKTRELLGILHKCYDCSLGLVPEFDTTLTSLKQMKSDLAQIANNIDDGDKSNKFAQVALNGASCVASAGGAASTGAALVVTTSTAIAAAPVVVPILLAASGVATVVGIGLGIGAFASHAVTEKRIQKEREVANEKLTEQQKAIAALIQKTSAYQVHEAALSKFDDGMLKGLYFSFKARSPNMSDEAIAKKIMDAYTAVSTIGIVLRSRDIEEPLDSEKSLKFGETHEPMVKAMAISQVIKLGALTTAKATVMITAKAISVPSTMLGAQLAAAATRTVPVLSALAVAIDGASLAYSSYQLKKKGTNEDAETVRSHIPKVQEQIDFLSGLRNNYLDIKKGFLELTEDHLKVKLLMEIADKIYAYFAQPEAEESRVVAIRNKFNEIYKHAQSLTLEQMQALAEQILGSPAPVTATTIATTT